MSRKKSVGNLPPSATLAAAMRDDGWYNAVTGFGTSRDKLTYGYHAFSPRLGDDELSSLFYSNDVAAKLVEKRPEEAFRRGYKLCNPTDEKLAAELAEQGKELDIDGKLQEAFTWGRLFGGALLVIGTDGGGAMSLPLDETKVRSVRFLNVVDRRFATIKSYYKNPLAPKYGQPELYTVVGLNGASTDIHESRVIRFDGIPVDFRERQNLGGWTYSVLQRPYEVMRAFETAFQAASVLTADASQAVFTMKGLFDMIASGEKARLQERMKLVDMSRSSARAVLLDADGEKFERVRTEFAGLPEMIDRMMMRMASAVDTPVTLLMGRSPAGQNATGDSDFKHWYDSIASQQKKELEPKVQRFYCILSRGKVPKIGVGWASLTEPTDKEKAEVAKYEAEAWATYVDKEILKPQEVALAKWGKGSNGQVVIDEKFLKESLKAEQELELDPPAPVVMAPPQPGQVPAPTEGEPPAPADEEDAAE